MLNNSPGMEDIFAYSDDNNCYHYVSAAVLKSPHITKPTLWPEPVDFEAESAYQCVDLTESNFGDILSSYSRMIADYIQFPRSTAFMHCMGCIAAAMTRNFKVKFGHSELYANLYIVTAQPPSTGKSAINDFCFNPIYRAYSEYNSRNEKARIMHSIEIDNAEKQLSKKGNEPHDIEEAIDRLQRAKEKLAKVAYIKPTITNATVEALEREAGKQGGIFNIISDEADSINVVLGAVYSDEKSTSKGNSEVILKGWDNGIVSSTRIGRDGMDGRVRGSIAVLAQADSVDTILAAGASGRGIAERFFLLNEPSLLGKRDRSKRPPIDKPMMSIYDAMIENIILEDETTLNFTKDAEEYLLSYEASNEKNLADDGDYSDNLLTGFVGKSAKQIRKIAAVLHVSEEWKPGGNRSLTIDFDCAARAVSIFSELAKTFKSSGDSLGHVGRSSEITKLIEVITRNAEKNKLKINVNSLRDNIKKSKPFSGSRNLMKKLRDELLPTLERMHYCVLEGQTIYINPRLK